MTNSSAYVALNRQPSIYELNSRKDHRAWQHLTKVPKITGWFWTIKIITTAMGEATSDFLDHRFSPYAAGTVGFLSLVLALYLQFKIKRYNAWSYWFAISMVAVFGTMAADGLHVELHVPYIDSSIFYAVVLLVLFVSWRKSEGTISIHSIYTFKREVFYWLSVLATFAMGTAVGDLTAYSFGLGYLVSGLIFIGLFCLPAIAYFKFGLNEIFCFWFAYIMTRPLGASFADWFGVPKSLSGLGFGRGTVSLVLTIILVALVAFVSLTHKDASSSG